MCIIYSSCHSLLPHQVHSQYPEKNLPAHRKVGFGLSQEVFFLNLEDGYFGCQVNESTDYLQLFELSKLCDGSQDCYRGSDELHDKLKCSSEFMLPICNGSGAAAGRRGRAMAIEENWLIFPCSIRSQSTI